MIKTVIFDIDDTLYDFWAVDTAGKERVRDYAAANCGVDGDLFLETFLEMARFQFRVHPDVSCCHSRVIRAQLACEKLGLPIHYALGLADAYWSAFLETITPYDGIPELFDDLRARGMRIGIGTNMVADLQIKKLVRLGLADKCDFMVSSEEADAEKPAPDFFAVCIDKAGCAPGECLFIGDNPKVDTKGAMDAGMQALLFAHAGIPEGYDMPAVVSAGEVIPYIDRHLPFRGARLA